MNEPNYRGSIGIVGIDDLFQAGMDTAEIAQFLGCSEATAYNELHEQRRWRLGFLPKYARYFGQSNVRREQ